MKKKFSLPLGVQFVHDTETQALTLASLAGMTCGHNGREAGESHGLPSDPGIPDVQVLRRPGP